MDELKTVVNAMCILSAGAYIIELLLGSAKLKRQITHIIAMFMALTLLRLFGNAAAGFELPQVQPIEDMDINFSSQLYQKEIEERTAENICKVLMQQLDAAGHSASEIEADVNISPEGCISITKVRLKGCDAAGAEIVRQSLGCEKEVVEIEGDT